MPTDHIVSLLIAERDKLNQAIAVLSSGTITTGKRRGRPPKNPVAAAVVDDPSMPDWVQPTAAKKPARKKVRTWSAAQKKAAAERMRQRWAEKKKVVAKTARKATKKTA